MLRKLGFAIDQIGQEMFEIAPFGCGHDSAECIADPPGLERVDNAHGGAGMDEDMVTLSAGVAEKKG